MEARAEALAQVVADTGAVEIHPFDDPRVQAGQGTATLELLEAVPAIGMVVAPGERRRAAVGHRHRRPRHRPDRSRCGAPSPSAVDDAYRSLAAGHLVLDGAGDTIADGLVAQLSEHDPRHPPGRAACRWSPSPRTRSWRRCAASPTDAKQIVEPSGAVALAGLARLARGRARRSRATSA